MAGHGFEFDKVERRKEVARFCVLSTGKNQSVQRVKGKRRRSDLKNDH